MRGSTLVVEGTLLLFCPGCAALRSVPLEYGACVFEDFYHFTNSLAAGRLGSVEDSLYERAVFSPGSSEEGSLQLLAYT